MSWKRHGFKNPLRYLAALTLMLAVFLVVAAPVSADTITVCPAGPPACDYGAIQAAVAAAGGGDVIHVYPGIYGEGVNLSLRPGSGDLTLVTVNSAGVPTPGTVTVENPGAESEIYTTSLFDGDLTIDGFNVHSLDPAIDVGVSGDHDVEIRNVTATNVHDDGIRVWADSGDVTITNCTASNNEGVGIWVDNTGGDVTITDCTTNDNLGGLSTGGLGILVVAVEGDVLINNCTANNNVCATGNNVHPEGYVSECGHGVWLEAPEGEVSISNCTMKGNSGAGAGARDPYGAVSITDSVLEGNGAGIQSVRARAGMLVNGSIVCGNTLGLFVIGTGSVNAEGNWWGCAAGPGNPGCDAILAEGTVDFQPWVSRVTSAASVDPVMAWEPTVVSFQFSGGPPGVYLGQGPGDVGGPAPFTVSTDNGTLNGNGSSVGAFINAADGTLNVSLVPHHGGTATVVLQGPCGLEESVVLAVEAEFVPEPGTLLLLGSGLMGLAGYAGLRLKKR